MAADFNADEARVLIEQERGTVATALTRAELAFMLAVQLEAALAEIDRLRERVTAP